MRTTAITLLMILAYARPENAYVAPVEVSGTIAPNIVNLRADAIVDKRVSDAHDPNYAADPRLDHSLVGTTPAEWTVTDWENSAPLSLHDLHGRVVLVRWFRGSVCPYCSTTAPALRALYTEFKDRGLVVVGFYNDDAKGAATRYAADVTTYGFAFPVARDAEQKTLRAWWLDGHEREFASVSFLIDRRGRVRGIHQGGRYAIGDPDFDAMHRAIARLVTEPEET